MARVTVEDCLDKVDNLFQLVVLAAKRARQIYNGSEPRVPLNGDKPTVLALREIAGGQIKRDTLLDQYQRDVFAQEDVEDENFESTGRGGM